MIRQGGVGRETKEKWKEESEEGKVNKENEDVVICQHLLRIKH